MNFRLFNAKKNGEPYKLVGAGGQLGFPKSFAVSSLQSMVECSEYARTKLCSSDLDTVVLDAFQCTKIKLTVDMNIFEETTAFLRRVVFTLYFRVKLF